MPASLEVIRLVLVLTHHPVYSRAVDQLTGLCTRYTTDAQCQKQMLERRGSRPQSGLRPSVVSSADQLETGHERLTVQEPTSA